jgi:N6-adenosine-specific RNA methylase IME4
MNEINSLVIFTKASQMLAEADTIQKAKELKNLALTAADWAKRKGMGEEAIQYCRSYALEAERRMGEILRQTERAKGAIEPGTKRGTTQLPIVTTSQPTLSDLGLTKRESAEAQMLSNISRNEFDEIKAGKKTVASVKRERKRKAVIAKLESIEAKEVKVIGGVYDVIVIDPPWPMVKIERDVRPNQVETDYPTMTEDAIHRLKIPYAEDCHIWIWTTQKFLPSTFQMIQAQGLTYVCTFVWHKPGGFQPVGLPQYNCEFAIYCKIGKPQFIDTKAFPVCFNATRGAHSEKPEEFYDIVRRVTAGRRLDMFSRRKIEGFDGWGKEVE